MPRWEALSMRQSGLIKSARKRKHFKRQKPLIKVENDS